MRISKVYTRTGDDGKTRLAGGQQVWKDALRVDAYGTVDELNASIGVVRAFNMDQSSTITAAARLENELRWVQSKLFDIGGLLATAPGQTFENMPRVTAKACSATRKADRCVSKGLGAIEGVHFAGRRKSRQPLAPCSDGLSSGRTAMCPSGKRGTSVRRYCQILESSQRCLVCACPLDGSPSR